MIDPRKSRCFRFLERSYDPDTGRVELTYAFDEAPVLTETLQLPACRHPLGEERARAFSHALDLLHLVAGVSYYKAGLPERIDVGSHRVDAELAAFLERTWTRGLGEFAHLNGLNLAGKICFPVVSSVADKDLASSAGEALPALGLAKECLVAMGGGKDSLVSLEGLREAGLPVFPVTVGRSPLILETAQAAELPLLQIDRRIAPGLLAYNKAGAWNGHVPVTAINSAILACVALLTNRAWVVFSNERSAEEATLINAQGEPVNHQYSKSFAFEQDFQSLVERRVAPDLKVFSLLRTLSEPHIARKFSALKRYHRVFSSCNRNFHHDGPRINGRWCGNCPKCRFTTLALAPWLSPAELEEIFGANLLDDPGQLEGYRALCALGRNKPFECVGTAEESRALMATLSSQTPWRSCSIVRALAPEVQAQADRLETIMTAGGDHNIPPEVQARVGL